MVKGRRLPDFEVDHIVARKRVAGKILYRVRWKGFDSNSDTWEPVEHLKEVKDLVQEFEGKGPKLGRRKKEKRTPKPVSESEAPEPSIKLDSAAQQGNLTVDEVDHLIRVLWQGRGKYMFEVAYKPRKNGTQVANSLEKLDDLRYCCPQLVIDMLSSKITVDS